MLQKRCMSTRAIFIQRRCNVVRQMSTSNKWSVQWESLHAHSIAFCLSSSSLSAKRMETAIYTSCEYLQNISSVVIVSITFSTSAERCTVTQKHLTRYWKKFTKTKLKQKFTGYPIVIVCLKEPVLALGGINLMPLAA